MELFCGFFQEDLGFALFLDDLQKFFLALFLGSQVIKPPQLARLTCAQIDLAHHHYIHRVAEAMGPQRQLR